jgi:hypothetical protein
VKDDPSHRAVSPEETRAFAEENDLLYIGESSALSDTNIREVVEALMDSKIITECDLMSVEIHSVQLHVEDLRA